MLEPSQTLLELCNLRTAFHTESGQVRALDGVSFTVEHGKTLAIVGESGCGKSVTAMSIMGLIQDAQGFIESGDILFEGQNLVNISKKNLQKLRGNRISMIFQEPMTALNPVYSVGEQIAEVLRIHRAMSRQAAKQETLNMLKLVHIADPEHCYQQFPHQLSGGMRQRIMIAMALCCEPKLLIADEPTTALDVTIQAQILRLMQELQRKKNTAIIFITHDLGVVAEIADHVVVMYAGQVVEYANVFDLFANPKHPYTKGLLNSLASLKISKKHKLPTIEGTVPSLKNLPNACRFNTRCPLAQAICFHSRPPLQANAQGHQAACHLVGA